MRSKNDCAHNPACGARTGIDRRNVLKAGAVGSVMLVTLPLGCSQQVSPPTGPVSAGNVSTVPVGTLRVLDAAAAVIGRDSGGLYGMSASCTHAGCLLSELAGATAPALDCPCHNSRFDANGAVTAGPARSPLPHYQVDLATDGSITIQGGIPVASTARTPV